MHELITRIVTDDTWGTRVVHRVWDDRAAKLAFGVILAVMLLGLFAPWLVPNDPLKQHAEVRLEGPGPGFPLGTDQLGRCVLSRVLWGARPSLGVAVLVVVAALIIGVPVGLVAGYFGGIIDEVLMRVVDILLSFPGIIFALVVIGILGPSLLSVMTGLALVHWTSYARVVRGTALAVKQRPFVEAARAVGAGHGRIMVQHILPHCLGPVLVMVTLGMGHVMLGAAAMSFLGLGAQPPTAEWGAMLNEARDFIRVAPLLMVPPGFAIMLTVLSFNILGDGLRDALEPHGTQYTYHG